MILNQTDYDQLNTDPRPIHLTDKQTKLGRDLFVLYKNIISEAELLKEYFQVQNLYFQSNNKCCDNLFCYLALRRRNIEQIQLRLAQDGVSSLGRLEENVLTSLEQILKHYGYSPIHITSLGKINQKEAQGIISERTQLLLGRPRGDRITRIMVTVDSDMTYQPELLEELLKNGMDIARINCAYGTQQKWKMVIDAIRNAEQRLKEQGHDIGRKCRIVMDLAGPKIRIKSTGIGTEPLKIKVPKDTYRKPIKLIEGFLDSEAQYTKKTKLTGVPESFVISITDGIQELADLEIGETLFFYDSRNRYRTITVLEKISKNKIRVGIEKSIFLDSDIILYRKKYYENFNQCPLPRNMEHIMVAGKIESHPLAIETKKGDKIILLKTEIEKLPNSDNSHQINCTMPEVLEKIEVGHRVLIDDGKLGARVISKHNDFLELEIIYPSDTTARIKTDKGLNFPDSNLDNQAITSQDIEDLKFIVKNATAVGISFAHSQDDIQNLYQKLINLGHPDFGVIAKIETRTAVHNLGRILLTGLSLPKFGILIARGDLAIEMGFENLSLIQEDILCLCEAAHIPVILATQILETLSKSGLPTRAEIIDAARGQRAECVMLNKGKYIVEAVRILSGLLKTEQQHNIKKRQIFREFTHQNVVFDIDYDAINKNNTENKVL